MQTYEEMEKLNNMNNRLVMYNINSASKEKQLLELCNRLGIQAKKVKNTDTDTTLAILAGIEKSRRTGNNRSNEVGCLPELIIFSGMADAELDVFLQEYRKMKIEPVRLKAILTIHNINWTLGRLIGELIQESSKFNR